MADPIADERDRRQSMAQQMLGLPDDWLAEFDGDEDLNPNNIPKPENDEQEDRLAVYYSVAALGGAAQQRADAPFVRLPEQQKNDKTRFFLPGG
jgi:hypothetical protein